MENSKSITILDCSDVMNPTNVRDHIVDFSKKLGDALSGIGFTYLTNTGVDLRKVTPPQTFIIVTQSQHFLTQNNGPTFSRNYAERPNVDYNFSQAIDRVYEVSKEFFDKSAEIKNKMRKPPGAASFHGYAGPGDELLNESSPNATELREFFDVTGHIESNDEKYFPQEVPGFKDAFDQARKECFKLSETILRCIAIYLGLEEDDLLKRHTHLYDRSVPTQTVMRSSMYSPLKDVENVRDGSIRCGEHCDWHTITLLFQDMVGGLEVRGTDGEWIAATPIEDAILLNSGQLLEIYSGGKLPATPHRIRILNDDKLYFYPRQSLVYCPSPDGPEDVEPLVPILKELENRTRSIYGPSSYDKVNAYEWVHNRHAAAASY